jgi:sugar diacid utilization regulator
MVRDQVTVGRLLEERLLREAEVLAGEGLAQPVRWCHSLRDLDRPRGDLHGVAVMADESELTPEVVAELGAAGVPALFVFGADAQRWAGQEALGDAVVVSLPDRTTHRGLAEMVARLALAHESHVLLYAQRVHSALAELLHRGAGVEALCHKMSRLSGCSVAVADEDLRLLAFENGPNHWLDPTILGVSLRPLFGEVSAAFDGAHHEPHAAITVRVEMAQRPVTAIIAPIELADRRDGWVLLVDATDPPHEHDLAEHRVVVQQAATIVGTELLRVRSVERAEERARGNFVHALLHGRFSTHADLVARASFHDFPTEGRYAVVVARSSGLIADGDSPSRLAEMAREAGRIQPLGDGPTLAAVVGDVIGVVRPVAAQARNHRDRPDQLRAYAAALEQRLSRTSGRRVMVAFGRPVRGAEQIMESYREARVALDLRERLRVEEVCGFDDLRVDSALLSLARDHTGRAFAEDTLRSLRDDRGGALLDVAKAYVEAGGNLNEASRRLNVHRNTLLYKLDRISRLLQRDIREADTQFTLWLALRLANLAETVEMVDRDLSSG